MTNKNTKHRLSGLGLASSVRRVDLDDPMLQLVKENPKVNIEGIVALHRLDEQIREAEYELAVLRHQQKQAAVKQQKVLKQARRTLRLAQEKKSEEEQG